MRQYKDAFGNANVNPNPIIFHVTIDHMGAKKNKAMKKGTGLEGI